MKEEKRRTQKKPELDIFSAPPPAMPKVSSSPFESEKQEFEKEASEWMKRFMEQMEGFGSAKRSQAKEGGGEEEGEIKESDRKRRKKEKRKEKQRFEKERKELEELAKMEIDMIGGDIGNVEYFKMDNYVDIRVPTHLLTYEHLISFDPESQLPSFDSNLY